jgi:hypothetical protein
MNRLRTCLPALDVAMAPSSGGGHVPQAVVEEVRALIRAISRKARFAEMHSAVLNGIDWDQCDDLGRRPAGTGEPKRLRVPLSEAVLVLEHPTAAIDHAYLAFDGLTAALVNMTDTLGRVLNLAYTLNLPPRQATLIAVRGQCNPASPLGVVLHNSQLIEWLLKVRELRGRCQHADVEEVLITRAGALSRRGEPYVDRAYSWRTPAQSMSMGAYAQDAILAADSCLDAAIQGILINPSNPLR